MAIAVYEVDGETRLFMPDTEWSYLVLGKLITMDHKMVKLGGEAGQVEKVQAERSQEELDRRDILLAKTGY